VKALEDELHKETAPLRNENDHGEAAARIPGDSDTYLLLSRHLRERK